jgi:hypothetical protein
MADALTPNTLAVSFELIPAIFFNKWILLARGIKESYQTPNRLYSVMCWPDPFYV